MPANCENENVNTNLLKNKLFVMYCKGAIAIHLFTGTGCLWKSRVLQQQPIILTLCMMILNNSVYLTGHLASMGNLTALFFTLQHKVFPHIKETQVSCVPVQCKVLKLPTYEWMFAYVIEYMYQHISCRSDPLCLQMHWISVFDAYRKSNKDHT